jgi:hypothetical protein
VFTAIESGPPFGDLIEKEALVAPGLMQAMT